MQFLTFMTYASVCVAVAVGVASDQIRRPGSRRVEYLVMSASAAAMVAALWLVSRPIPSLTVTNTAPYEEAAAPSPLPVPPLPVPSQATGEPRIAPDIGTVAPVPTVSQPSVAAPTGDGSTTSSPPPSAPSSPTTPPTQPPPTQPPPTQPPPTQQPPAPSHLVRSVVHAVETVVGSLHHAI
jgi:hypothetical protein